MTASSTDSAKRAVCPKTNRNRHRPARTRQPRRTLRFSPTAWAKLLYLRDRGPTEIGGFGISRADDLLFIEDLQLIRQQATSITVRFDDDAVADFFDEQCEQGRRPEEFGRIWIHTHPGNSPLPSGTDEETFSRVFGRCHWGLMFILARNGATYARLRFNLGPGGQIRLPVEVGYDHPFAASDVSAWEAEYQANVRQPLPRMFCIDPDPEELWPAFEAADSGLLLERFDL